MSTFVLLHGAWHGAWCWERVTPLLEGHRVTTPTLTGLGERAGEASAEVNLDTHIADLVAHLEGLEDVVLVAHSYSGFVAYGAAEKTDVGRLVLLDSFIPRDGETMAEHVGERGEQYRAAAAEDPDWLAPPPPAAVLGVAEADQEWVDGAMTPQPVRTYLQQIFLTGAAERLDRHYISCTSPALATIELSRRRMAEEGVPVSELACGHDAMIAAPDALAAILLR
jgi:pimeloyl-ACP methyl ester carboxylesterase